MGPFVMISVYIAAIVVGWTIEPETALYFVKGMEEFVQPVGQEGTNPLPDTYGAQQSLVVP